MKPLILISKAILLMAIIIVLNKGYEVALGLPFSWGDFMLHSKLYAMQKDGKTINTIYLGSSKANRHFNPEIIDEKLAKWEISSYNFGSPGTLIPETFYLYDEISRQEKVDLQYAFIELTLISPVHSPGLFTDDIKGLHSAKVKAYHNFPLYSFAVSAIQETALPYDTYKTDAMYYCTLTYAERLLHTDFMSAYYKMLLWNKSLEVERMKGMNTKRGFNPLYAADDPFRNKNRKKKDKKHSAFDDGDTQAERIAKKKAKMVAKAKTKIDMSEFNKAYLAKLLDIIDEGKRRGIHVVYVLQPRPSEDFMLELLPIMKRLPEEHLINMSNPQRYPEFYDQEHSHDAGHLNEKGAIVFSEAFADRFKEIIKMKIKNEKKGR